MSGIKRIARSVLSTNKTLFEGAKALQTFGTYILRRPHEGDYRAFLKLPAGGTFVDIGANRGQSALSFATVNRDWRIISFEANTTLEPSLAFVRKLIGARFEYHMVGIDMERATHTLHIPAVNGFEHSGEGTLHREQLDSPRIRDLLGDHFDIVERRIETVPFSAFSVSPDVVKIDVQGHEVQVLNAIAGTIDVCRPAIFMEYNERIQGVVDGFLYSKGYEQFYYDAMSHRLERRRDGIHSQNFFSIHPQSRPDIRAALLG